MAKGIRETVRRGAACGEREAVLRRGGTVVVKRE